VIISPSETNALGHDELRNQQDSGYQKVY